MTPDCPLIKALMRPDAFPHRVSQLDVLETHISWILLTGEYAYKIKKPVNLGFVDFSTRSLREQYCREELRLNQRYAGELYLDVVPIGGTRESPVIGDTTEEPIEFAVQMKQFSQTALLSEMLTAGTLTSQHIDQLADRVARFHEQADKMAPEGPFATAEEIYQEAIDNLDTLQQRLPKQFQLQLPQLRSWTEQRFDQLQATFASRRATGFVRECHGDLHLGNIIDWHGDIMLFDGIEFNPGFRWIDILSDAAFAAMDLEDRGRADLTHRFTNAYLERTGDYHGMAVWKWYLVYRALVRAKVAAIRVSQSLDEQQVAGSEREQTTHEMWSEAATYLNLAERYTQPAPPCLMITFGPSGSGKTFGTQEFVEQLGAIRIRSDIERKRLFGLKTTEHSHSATGEGIYSSDATTQTYRHLRECAQSLLQSGETVIVDATFLSRSVRDSFHELADDLGVTFVIIPFNADRATLRSRIAHRQTVGGDASEATFDVLERQLTAMDLLGEDELPYARETPDAV